MLCNEKDTHLKIDKINPPYRDLANPSGEVIKMQHRNMFG